MWERERRFKLQNKKDIRFSTLARWIFFRARCWGQEVVGWNPAGKEECQDESKLSLAAAAAAAAAGVSDLVFVEGKGQSNYSTRVFKIFKVGNVQLSCWWRRDGSLRTGMKRQECVWMCFIFCADKPCLCAISFELLSFLKSKYNLQLTHVQNSKRTTCYSFCKSMSPFEHFRRHRTSGTFVPVAAKKIMLPHCHVLQEYLKTPNMLKTLTFVEVP